MTRVRFAPTPTASLSISGARVALANDLFARRTNGRFMLRLDDLDTQRSPATPPNQNMADQLMQDLHWFGIGWHTSVRQTDRLELYQATIERLKREQFLYPCFETEEELRAKQEFRRKRNQPTIYDRAMLALTDQQRRTAEAGGKRPHWRFRLSGRTLQWDDLILGPRHAALSAVSDPILVRADGSPAPILASVVDDVDCATTHVIRGEDSAANTAVQIELHEVLSQSRKPIRFAHLPVLGPSAASTPGGRRSGTLALRGLRNDGIEPCAITACMIGVNSANNQQLTFDDLAKRIDLPALATPNFDVKRMLAINRRVLGSLEFAAVADRLPSGATEAFWLAVRGSLDLLKEARGWWDVVAGTIVPPVIDGAGELLLAARSLLPPEPWDNAVWSQWIAALERVTGRTGDGLLLPLRLALTGEDSGPDLSDLLPLIGRTRAASRLEVAAA